MTVDEARKVIQSATICWPFTRLSTEQLASLEEAYKVVRQHEIDKLGEGRF